MKQTNNAIKFLMAQYRAIFKNANLKMFLAAATAAAAMAAAGSAQADDKDWANAHTVTAQDVLKAEGSGDVAANVNEFNITLTQAGNEIKTTDTKDAATFTAANGSITLNGQGAALTIGSTSASGATVDIKKFTGTEGTLTIQGSGTTTSTLKAGEIVLGTAPEAPSTKAPKTVTVELKAKGVIGDATKTTSFSIYDGGELKFTGAGAKALSKTAIAVQGGKITITDAATDATIQGKLNITSGSVNVSGGATAGSLTAKNLVTLSSDSAAIAVTSGSAAGGSFTAEKGLTMTNGKITVDGGDDATKAAKLTIKGKTSVTSGTVTLGKNSALKLDGDASFAKGTLKLDAATKVELGTLTGTGSRTLTVDSADIKTVLATANAISGEGTANNTFILELADTETVNLETSGLVTAAGAHATGLAIKTAKLSVKGDKASYAKGELTDATTYDFNTLEVGASNAFELKGGAGVTVRQAISDKDSAELNSLKVTKGTLKLNGASGTVSAKVVELAGAAADEANFTVESGDWSVKALSLKTSGAATVKGNLTVGGELTIADANSTLKVEGGSVSTVGSGSLVAKAAADNSIKLTKGTLKFDGADILDGKNVDANKLKVTAISGDGASIIEITDEAAWTAAEFKTFKEKFTGFSGVFKMDNVDVADTLNPDGSVDFGKLTDGLATEAYNNATLNVETADLAKTTGSYSVGNVHVKAEQNLELAAGGSMFLNSADKDGNFVAKQSGEAFVTAGVDFKGAVGTQNTLSLVGKGNIGAITTATNSTGTLNIGRVDTDPHSAADVTVLGSIGADATRLAEVEVADASSLNVQSGDVFTANLMLGEDSKLSVSGKVAVDTASITNSIITVGSFSIKDSQGDKAFKFDEGKMNVTGTLSFGASNNATIGTAGDVVPPAVTTAEGDAVPPVPAPNLGTSAQVFAGTVELKTGSTIFVDPSSSIPSSLLVGKVLSDGTTEGKLAGNLAIGNNSAIAFGYDEAGFVSAVSNYMVDGKFNADLGIKNALVLNTPISVANGAWINVDAGMTKAEQGANSADLNLADGATLIITKDALANGAAITFEKAGSGTVAATDKSSIRLEGGITLADNNKQLFAKAKTDTAKAKIYAAAGLIDGKLNADGTVTLTANDEKLKEVRAVASAPVADLLVDYRDGKFANNSGAGLDFIGSSLLKNDFVAIDAAAHAATYAGAQQSAVAAVGTMAEAVGGRVGSMGVEAATIAATGSQVTGGVWLSPMYKSVDADGFNAQGASYGSDIDLAGVAFGADTVDGNTRYGVVFNIGSGEAEGKGNGNGLKDDFDYYGIGLYSVRASNNFAVVADASYNVISHDVEGLGAKGSAETVALTAGLTGQYTLSSPMVDVTPHLGARFIRLDTDSYDLVAGGDVVAETDFDVQNVFSVPLGVTLSKAFEMGGWSLAPSADLSITFNTGDTDVESNTYFTGTKNYGFTTEVLDEVTYGIAVGLGAQYGAFGTNIGLNYTGSENTDSFGVNAQARYMF